MVLLATAQIKTIEDLPLPKTLADGASMKTRDIINFINENFEEKISSGSYDDIRRKDLKSRGYALNPLFAPVFATYKTPEWQDSLSQFLSQHASVSGLLDRSREVTKIPIEIEGGILEFSNGEHNVLQKAIIEEFLPIFGYGAEVLYVGDTADKFLYLKQERLDELNFFKLDHGELPDVVAYSSQKNWIYLIEAVHSSGPISETRLLELKRLTQNCTAGIVYVTAFLTRDKFRAWVKDIAWETEVWLAESPTHMVHFNGDRFTGPYAK